MQSPWYASPAMSKSHGNEPSSALVGVGRFELPTSRRGGVVSGVPRQPLAEPRAPRRGAAEGREYSGAIEDRDGCTCPPWVVCGHFGGKILWLVDRNSLSARCGGSKPRFGVGLGSEVAPCSACEGHAALWGFMTRETAFDTDSLPAAEAEFEARNRELLGRTE